MEDSRQDKVEQLFEEAHARPKEERAVFLREHCADEALRKEVASLLKAYEEAPAFFEGFASSVVAPMLSKIVEEGSEGKDSAASDPLALEGTSLGRYQVEEHLGGGGMGVVYRARDTRLDRSVALKFLPPHLSWHEEAGRRFVREARSAAALDHSNVATIHEIGQTEGSRRFIAMAYYEGETLKEKFAREGPLPVEEALDYARQIGEGLGRAHEAGIVHRDVKPANVMVTRRGRVKLLDFGLARVVEETRLTDPGRRLGTAAYMSPEQARGEAVDARTDLWALGAVLYEMLTGERPFRGERERATLHAILHEEPVSLAEHRDDIPAQLQAIVERLLSKDPEKRYPSAEALLEDLRGVRSKGGASIASSAPAFERVLPAVFRSAGLTRRWLMGGALLLAALVFVGTWWFASGGLAGGSARGGEAETGRERSVAVLPFQVSGADAETWRDGMVTVLSTGLDGAAGLRAIPDRTVFAAFERAGLARSAAGQDRALETARQIGARYAVTGSAVTLRKKLRLIADVYEAASGERLGRAQVRGASENIMALADELTRRVLGILLERSEERIPSVNLASLTTESFPALKAFLRGERRFRAGDYEAAIADYKAAVKADSAFALAHARLGRSYRWLVELEKGRYHWQRAYEMSDRLPERERRAVRAHHLWLVQNHSQAAVEAFRQLTDAYPDDPRMWYELGEAVFHGNVPRGWPEAETAFEAAIDLDPGIVPYHHHFVDLAFALRRDSALAARRIAAHPESPYKRLYRLTMDLVFGSPDQQQEALARLDTMAIPGQSLPTNYALEHPMDAKIAERVHRRLVNRDDHDTQAFALRLTINLFEQGRFEEGVAQLQDAPLDPTFESCILATSVSLGVPIPDSILRPVLEPSSMGEDPAIGRLWCAGIYLEERGRDEELPALMRRIREAGTEQGMLEDDLQRILDELSGYRAWKAGDLERAARLWSASNPLDGSGALWRGDLYRELGELRKAEDWYVAAWGHPVAHERLGQLYEEMNQPEEAADAYERFIAAWTEADEPLQERVQAARERLEALTSTSANAG